MRTKLPLFTPAMSSTIETAPLPDSGTLTSKENLKDDNKEISNPEVSAVPKAVPVSNTTPKGLRFWVIMFALVTAEFLAALDLTGTTFFFPSCGRLSNGR
jgi:hypothetical protein